LVERFRCFGPRKQGDGKAEPLAGRGGGGAIKQNEEGDAWKKERHRPWRRGEVLEPMSGLLPEKDGSEKKRGV